MSGSVYGNPFFATPEEDPWATPQQKSQTGTGSVSTSNLMGMGASGILPDHNWSTYNSSNINERFSGLNILGDSEHQSNDDYSSSTKQLSESPNILGSETLGSQAPNILGNDLLGSKVPNILGNDPLGSQVPNSPIHEEHHHSIEEEQVGYSDDEEDEEEDDNVRPAETSIWSDEMVAGFNPLSYHNSDDKILIRVKEIPEKEGLVFKHINYLISHNLKFPSEYYSDNNKQTNGETKIIRRYSDFAWLLEVLLKKYPFRLIPELPPKKFAIASTNDPLFLQKRRRGLQRFLYQLAKHPILSKESMVIMFLTVPNDFSNWKKFANIEIVDEFEGVRVNLPRRFTINLDQTLKGLRDTESDLEREDDEEEEARQRHSSAVQMRNETIINSITQIWNESPVNYKNFEFMENVILLNSSLTRFADTWNKISFLVERIERREEALKFDGQRLSMCIDQFVGVNNTVYGVDNLIENKKRTADEEGQNLSIINTILTTVSKYFSTGKQLKEEEMGVITSEILENFKKFQDYYTSLHFLIERLNGYKAISEKQVHTLLTRITRANERLFQIKGKSDVKGSEIDKLVTVLTQSVEQLNTLISKIILVKAAFLNEYKLYQKTKYMVSEIFQDWFTERVKYTDLDQNALQRVFNELQDMPLK
ncbi:unnamed protein product [Ambrosiozyma monospora]|uniref:Sorting nexin MVP1 n=1 Tax=Ambrosiozyma monospora TaxID=43982 RepID=A0A9W6YRU2_AMBMO|nr:unnamed protein product [Ambrosiozyma monospora]